MKEFKRDIMVFCVGAGMLIGGYIDSAFISSPKSFENNVAFAIGALGIFLIFVGGWEAINTYEKNINSDLRNKDR